MFTRSASTIIATITTVTTITVITNVSVVTFLMFATIIILPTTFTSLIVINFMVLFITSTSTKDRIVVS